MEMHNCYWMDVRQRLPTPRFARPRPSVSIRDFRKSTQVTHVEITRTKLRSGFLFLLNAGRLIDARTEGIYGVAHSSVCRVRTVADGRRSDAGGRYLAASRGCVHGVSKLAVGGAGGWDYLALEASGARLFISRGDRVDVVETVSGKLAGTIPNMAGVHGIAFAPALKRGFTSNGG